MKYNTTLFNSYFYSYVNFRHKAFKFESLSIDKAFSFLSILESLIFSSITDKSGGKDDNYILSFNKCSYCIFLYNSVEYK